MKSKEFAVMQKLIDCATLSNLNRTFGNLAYYLLLNYNRLETLTIKAVEEACFISASSIRRFCQSIGYDNFSDLVEAKMRNPDNQRNIILENWRRGRYNAKTLHNEINNVIYSVSRTVSKTAIRELARDIAQADNIILFCVRPYSLWLREFQNQMIALGKPLYILEEVNLWKPMIARMEGALCSVAVSPAAQMLPALGHDLEQVPGSKSLVVCTQKLDGEDAQAYLAAYDRILSAKFKTHDYEYLELYGKYAVSFLFELILGEVSGLLQQGEGEEDGTPRKTPGNGPSKQL